MGKYDGKIALVGGNLGKLKKDKLKEGLGYHIAKILVDGGAQVCLVDLDFAVTQACATALGGKAKAYDCDLIKDRTYETEEYVDDRGRNKTRVLWKDNPALDMVNQIVGEFGKLDILITNFDKYERARLDSSDVALFDDLRDQNVTPVFHLLAAVREQFSTQTKTAGTYAKVVMITCMVGKSGITLGSLYAAFKGSIIGLTKSLAREFGRFANVNAVAYGPLAEKKMQGPKEKAKGGFMATQTDMASQPITFEKVAPLAAFLASDDAMAISGQTISVDGGLWLKLEQ
jgi:NAD(P)-dependent dehydrogenase (short-subunit alcohol dehydrogenase family)